MRPIRSPSKNIYTRATGRALARARGEGRARPIQPPSKTLIHGRPSRSRGPNLRVLRILHACCRSTLSYGLEFWGHHPTLIEKADSFIYGAIHRLFDMPLATPHRAISSEFGIIPTSLRYNTIIRKIAARLLRYRPLQFMDELFPPMTLEKTITTSINDQYQNLAPITKSMPINDFSYCKEIDFSGRISFDLIRDCDLLVFTDGSFKNDVASLGICIFSGASWKENISLYEKNQILTPRKSILDAEAIALVIGLRHSLNLSYTGHIYLISDNQTALRIFLPLPPPDLQYLASDVHTLLQNSTQIVRPTWIKGHSGNIGNDRADILAKSATDPTSQYDGPSYSHLNLTISTQNTAEWNKWFDKAEHYYKRRPSRRLTHLQHHTRLDTIALFKLRTNKGWHPKDPIGIQTP